MKKHKVTFDETKEGWALWYSTPTKNFVYSVGFLTRKQAREYWAWKAD